MPQFCSSALQRKSGVEYSDFGFQPKFNFSDVKMKWLISNLVLQHRTGSLWLIWSIHHNPWGNGQSLPRLCPPLDNSQCLWKIPRDTGISFFTYRGRREAESSPTELWGGSALSSCPELPGNHSKGLPKESQPWGKSVSPGHKSALSPGFCWDNGHAKPAQSVRFWNTKWSGAH